MQKKFYMCFIYVYFWNRKMDNPVFQAEKAATLIPIGRFLRKSFRSFCRHGCRIFFLNFSKMEREASYRALLPLNF